MVERMRMRSRKKISLRAMTQSALFASLLCILSPVAIPAGPIPVTLGVFAVLFAAVVLPWKQAGTAVLVYLFIGLIGIPVFSGGGAGPAVFAGATGGYLWCYLPMAILAAWIARRGTASVGMALLGNLLALLLCYAMGTLQFTRIMACSISYALGVCVYPFVFWDAVKLIAAALLGVKTRRRLQAAGLLN